ncbi:hypothetical protein [Burkholderia vietnamiensis]|uniref:hypothetical protein n=1 Tax=Burkholderia vietnamiensis TaxID=60552 RepID=UPI000AFEE6B7|nr:hypothetical protein [Burkholderia vietnamiensis]
MDTISSIYEVRQPDSRKAGKLRSGGYFTVKNSSGNPIDLTGVDSDAFGMASCTRHNRTEARRPW